LKEEVVEEKDLVMLGLLKKIGIEKGTPFKLDEKNKLFFDEATKDAHQHLIRLYHEDLIAPYYPGKKWTIISPPGVFRSRMTYTFPGRLDYENRGVAFFGILSSVKNISAAPLYLNCAKDIDGEWLDGSKMYKLNVPANVPAEHFWSITAYDLETAGWIKEQPKVEMSSIDQGVQTNDDGTVDVYMGPKPPEGKEANWIPSAPGKKFFIMFRIYGPKIPMGDMSWQLNDIERIK
jgi:hypothetical protein